MFSKFQWNWTTFIFCIIIITINCLIKIMINCLIIIMINCFIIIMINCCIIIVADNCDLLLMNQVYKFITWFLLSYSKLLIQRCLWFAVVACFGYNILFPVAFAIRNRGRNGRPPPVQFIFNFMDFLGKHRGNGNSSLEIGFQIWEILILSLYPQLDVHFITEIKFE